MQREQIPCVDTLLDSWCLPHVQQQKLCCQVYQLIKKSESKCFFVLEVEEKNLERRNFVLRYQNQSLNSNRTLVGRRSKISVSWTPPSHKRAVRSEYVRIAFAIYVLGVAFDAVAAVDLSERGCHKRRRGPEELGVGESAGKLQPL